MSAYDEYYTVADVKPRRSVATQLKLDEPQIEALTNLAKVHGVSFTALVRRACRELLTREAAREKTEVAAQETEAAA